MNKRMERIINRRITEGDKAAKVATSLRNALAGLMASEGEPRDEDPLNQAAWLRARRALAKYDAWNAN